MLPPCVTGIMSRVQIASSVRPDRPVPALIGNGQLVTTLDLHGYHMPVGVEETAYSSTQSFVMAGRRHGGAQHPLVDFGILTRTLSIDGDEQTGVAQGQTIYFDSGEIRSRTLHGPLLETTRTLIVLGHNLFFVETTLDNRSSVSVTASLELDYRLADRSGKRHPGLKVKDGLRFEHENNLGQIHFRSDGSGDVHVGADSANALHFLDIGPGESAAIRTWLVFSDRIRYEDPVGVDQLDVLLAENQAEWARFWNQSSISVGNEDVERFRASTLYTLRCQATPWSIPPTVSKPYWDGGAFHDELYPFLGLLSGGHGELASKVPHYRLATLPRALERGRACGALYPWSATEQGEERDPLGHWYTERFHLGQIAACAWWLWLHGEDVSQLDDLYPVLRETARYFQHEVIEACADGKLRTKRCTDFDESVGQIAAGPMTMGAAIFSLERAAEAARRLGRDREYCKKWERLAHGLRDSLVVDRQEKRYGIPEGKSLHLSIAGLVAPFFVDTVSDYARNSVRAIYDAGRTDFGWKAGLSEVFDGTTWIWTAGHLGMCFSVLGDGDGVWDCVARGPLAASQFLSPNEHLNKDGTPIVPWFTTGCGAWLTALHWMFVRVDDGGMHVLPAAPKSLANFSFRGLSGVAGVTVACQVSEGKVTSLKLTSPVPQPIAFEMPKVWSDDNLRDRLGDHDDYGDRWRFRVSLQPGENELL